MIADKNHYLIKHLLVISCLGFLGIWLWRLGVVWFSSAEYIVTTVPDDAFYYLHIARNVSQGAGSTFDGISNTNGYHPLWLMMESAVSFLSGTFDYTVKDSLLFLRVMLTFQLGLGLISACLLGKTLWIIDRSGTLAALAIAGLATPYCIYAMTDGMESGLVLLFLSSLILVFQKLRPLKQEVDENDFAFGAILAMGLMARLDLALLILALGVGTTVLWASKSIPKWKTQVFLKKGVAWGVPVLLTLGLYLFINSLHFDTVTPISGQLKNHFPTISSPVEMINSNLPYFLLGVVGIVISGVLFLLTRSQSIRFYAVIATLYLLIHGCSIFLYTNWGVHKWHFTAWWIVTMLSGLFLLQAITSTILRTMVAWAVIPIILLFSVLGQWLFLRNRTQFAFQTRSYTAALWARENLPKGATVAMSDCGTFAFFHNGPVINLDGVVNNREFQDTLVREGLEEYLNQKGSSYIAHHAFSLEKLDEMSYDYDAYSHLYQESGGGVKLTKFLEQYRGDVFQDGTGEKVFVIWNRPVGVKIPTPAR